MYDIDAPYQNGLEDAEDAFLDAQIRRLELLEELYNNGKPVDVSPLASPL